MIVCNKQGLILRTNEAMQKLTGFAKEKLLTENWNDYFSLEGENLAQERYEKLMLDGQYGPYQMTIMTNDQKSIYLQAQDYLSKDDGGHTQIWTFASDITKERIALHRLAKMKQDIGTHLNKQI